METAYDKALNAMLKAGIDRDRAGELLHGVWEQAQAQTREHAADTPCIKCSGSPLNDLLGHDHLGHKTANSLTVKGVRTPEDLLLRGLEWVLDFTSVGARGVDRIQERMSPEGYRRFSGTRWSD